MMNEENGLHAYLRQKAASTAGAEEEVDWKQRKEKWLKHVARLYKMIHKWIAPLESDGTVRSQTSSESLEEDHIGQYQVDVLTLFIGKQRVEFHPKGTLIIGADGRVDVHGQHGIRTLVLKEERWSIVERLPRLRTFPFNEDSFQDVLREVME